MNPDQKVDMIRPSNPISATGPPVSRACQPCLLALLTCAVATTALAGPVLAQVAPPAAETKVDRKKAPTTEGPAFEVAYPSKLRKEPFSARVYVFLGPGSSKAEPRFGPDWFRPRPFFARDVKDWKPGQTV